MRRTDAAKAKAAATAGASVRAQIQEDIEKTRKQRQHALREQEKAWQFDRQREEIHPSSVLDTLKTFPPPEQERLRLSKATPDKAGSSSEQLLPIRYREKEVQ